MNAIYLSIAAGLLAIFYSLYLTGKILKLPTGAANMVEIADAIAAGSAAYLKRQYQTIALVSIVVFFILSLSIGITSAIFFLFGAITSAISGFIGMNIAVRANIRCSESAKKGLSAALSTAFGAGAATGLVVGGLALLSVCFTYLIILVTNTSPSLNLTPLIALGFGGSLISVFARLGGGIYTKGADVGTDMVGKIEKGFPEDDPRNPGVIADLVGDNVGDDAGMAADLFETYLVTAVSAMLLGQIILPDFSNALIFPLLLGSCSIIASIIGTFFVRVGKDKKIMLALYKGLAVTSIVSAILFYVVINTFMTGNGMFSTSALFYSTLIGIVVTIGMVAITEYYTSKNYPSVLRIATASQAGHGTNVIAGLAVSLKATFLPILLICLATLFAFYLAGIYGIAVAATAMLSLTPIVVAIDAFGPITDNAGGIAEMTNQPESVRDITDALDAVGNTTKAVTKAYAIASAGLAALVLFAAFTAELTLSHFGNFASFSLNDPLVLIGLLLGASIPYLFASFAMEAVGNTAKAVVTEVRRQFKEIKGIMKGENKPEYARAVDIVTSAALKEMVVPALLPVLAPILVGFIFGAAALGGFLVGIIITGLFVAISMTTGGAAWDNAKKYIEEGNLGGKGSPAHQAAVTGDTIGDPYKDTAGPAINPMIKVANIVALLIAPFLK